MRRTPDPFLRRRERPRVALGVAVAVLSVAAITGLVYPLEHVAPVVSLGVVYVLAVLVVSMYWAALLGVATSLARHHGVTARSTRRCVSPASRMRR